MLAPGTRVGPYEVVALLGAGGMGEVFRARDTKLGRDVALKVLPDHLATDPERLARFQREAQVLASLNHPHIAAIYGLEEGALVLELVEGETLADRIARGRIPADDALPIARQIAEALEAAHEHGVIHRDLKPANIKITPDGVVKVLDFGLAKLAGPPEGGPHVRDVGAGFSRPDATMSPTITSPAMMTGIGMMLGTAAYMSPEQAKGRPADKRSDVWAFGCVLFEMLTGTRAFEGEDVSETMAAVLKTAPDLALLPPEWRRLVAYCLEKDPRKRLRDVGDAWKLLETPAAAPVGGRSGRHYGWTAAAVVAAIALTGLASVYFRPAAAPASDRPLHLSIALPNEGDDVRSLALSPDGRTVVMAAAIDGKYQLWLRDLHASELRPLPGTDLARVPFWSPDSRTIGFFADGRLKVMPAAGGPARALCDSGLGSGGTWNRDGVILYGRNDGPIVRVDVSGGECTPLTTPAADSLHSFPEFLPDGRHFFYAVTRGDAANTGVYVASLDEPTGRRVLADVSSVAYAPPKTPAEPGSVLFLRESTLMAQPFDLDTLTPVGDPVVVTQPASMSNSPPQMAVSVSSDGTIAYIAIAAGARAQQLAWHARDGRELARLSLVGALAGVALDPGGRTAAVPIRVEGGINSALWFQDLGRNTATRFTALGQPSSAPVWSPDGRRIAFSGVRAGSAVNNLYVRDVAAADERLLLKTEYSKTPSDWSRDGRYVIYSQTNPKTQSDIWALPINADGTPGMPFAVADSPSPDSHGQLSPDGRWLAYISEESGTREVYLRPFPVGERQWRVSTSGGREPRWRGDGRELFYLEGVLSDLQMFAVPVRLGAEPELGTATPLFTFRASTGVPGANWFVYEPAPDGQRFLVEKYADNVQPTVDVLVNWTPR